MAKYSVSLEWGEGLTSYFLLYVCERGLTFIIPLNNLCSLQQPEQWFRLLDKLWQELWKGSQLLIELLYLFQAGQTSHGHNDFTLVRICLDCSVVDHKPKKLSSPNPEETLFEVKSHIMWSHSLKDLLNNDIVWGFSLY